MGSACLLSSNRFTTRRPSGSAGSAFREVLALSTNMVSLPPPILLLACSPSDPSTSLFSWCPSVYPFSRILMSKLGMSYFGIDWKSSACRPALRSQPVDQAGRLRHSKSSIQTPCYWSSSTDNRNCLLSISKALFPNSNMEDHGESKANIDTSSCTFRATNLSLHMAWQWTGISEHFEETGIAGTY